MLNQIKQMKDSITDFTAYPEFIKQSAGKVIKYIFIIWLVIGTLRLAEPLITFYSNVATFQTKLVQRQIQQLPDFKLAHGELEVYAQMPIIKNEKGLILVVDTTGHINESILNGYSKGYYLSKYKIVNKRSDVESHIIDFKSFKYFTITKDKVINWVPYFKWLSPTWYLFLMLCYLIAKLLTASILALLGLIMIRIQKASLSYSDMFIITVYSMSLPLILQLAKDVLFTKGIPYFGVIYYVLIGIYMWNAIKTVNIEEPIPLDSVIE